MLDFKTKINTDISLKPIRNKRNGQMNFSIKKTSLPKDIKRKLQHLKSIKLRIEDMEFN